MADSRKGPPGNLGVLGSIELDRSHHLAGPFLPPTPIDGSPISRSRSPATPSRLRTLGSFSVNPVGIWLDLKTMRWMTVPASSFQMIFFPALGYLNWHILQSWSLVPRHWVNPFQPFLFISHPVSDSPPHDPRYRKGYLDLLFIAYYVIFWSFIRQAFTLHVLHPTARRFGIKKASKLDRFGEQGYAVAYFTLVTALGLGVMSESGTWWYETKNFWIDYPHWQMTPLMKTYYLLHSAYWAQQLLVLALRLEKPRKDFTELVVHHIVTLWLVGWSYLTNLTLIGNAVFLTMDVSEVFLALSKMCNYLQLEKTKIFTFAWFCGVWTYFRHWLNLVMLWSVWTEFDLLPESSKQWKPKAGVWMAHWVKYQIFAPLIVLQVINLIWYFLIWRILLRSFSSTIDDERSDDEDDTDGGSKANGNSKSNKLLKSSRQSAHSSDKEQ